MRDGKNEWSMASENSPWFDRRTVFKILIAGRQRDTSRRARAVLEVPSAESSGLNYGGVWCGGVVASAASASVASVRRCGRACGGWPYVAYMAYVRKDRRRHGAASRAVGIIILPWP